jgi:hypothetical protein
MITSKPILVPFFSFLLASWNFVGAERHPHSGVVTPFKSGDPGIVLDKSAVKILESGKPYQTQIKGADATSGRGMVVQDVKAPVDVVWERILDFRSYPKMVPKTVESETYKRENLKHSQQRIWVRMKVGFPMLKLQFFVNHLYDPKKNSMTWTLDYSRKSDLDDSVGYWYVIPHPDNPGEWSRVYYSVQVSMFPWVPKFVVDFMSKQALTDATAWVKKYSEKEAAKRPARQKEANPQEAASEPALAGVGGDSSGRNSPGRGGAIIMAVDDDVGAAVSSSSSDSSTTQGGETPINRDLVAQPEQQAMVMAAVGTASKIGLKRYALVSAVLVLSIYNVHLYCSQ